MTSKAEKAPKSPVGFAQHDHAACVTSSLESAQRHCTEHGLRFTPVRRKVLEILLREHRAMGAYAILDILRDEGFGSQPPVAYRALDFLCAHGFVHKVEKLNAFVACAHPGKAHAPAFMICRKCDAVAEAEAELDTGAIGAAAASVGFEIERTVVEAEGLCPLCVASAGE